MRTSGNTVFVVGGTSGIGLGLALHQAAFLTVSSGLAIVPLPLTPTYNATKAAIHSSSESLRVQLVGTSVQVIELVPPAVRTTLMGQQDAPDAMPLEEFLDEAMALLKDQPEATKIPSSSASSPSGSPRPTARTTRSSACSAGTVGLFHIGLDRLLKYGVKYDHSFGVTHLGEHGRP